MEKNFMMLAVVILVSAILVPVVEVVGKEIAGKEINIDRQVGYQVIPSTDKLIYRTGEPVQISFLNSELKVVYLPEVPPWEIWRFSFRGFQWEKIIDPIALQVIDPILPGGTRSWTWDQNNSAGEQVSIGIYRADIPYSETLLDWQTITSHTYFLII